MSSIALIIVVFAACVVEAVEALTIVLAVGLTRGWRSTLLGIIAALIVLIAVVAALGPALTLIPINALRIVVGGLLLVFGLQWIRKAILRAAGLKAVHDEDAIFSRARSAASETTEHDGRLDAYAVTVAFKGVLLEGLEVVFIVLTFGANQGHVGLAALAAVAAVVLVTIVGFAVRAPLSRVPENSLKFGVGILLTSFGIFWGGEGAGAHWPGADLAILVIIVAVSAAAATLTILLRRRVARATLASAAKSPAQEGS